jgi:hypothetical protein
MRKRFYFSVNVEIGIVLIYALVVSGVWNGRSKSDFDYFYEFEG